MKQTNLILTNALNGSVRGKYPRKVASMVELISLSIVAIISGKVQHSSFWTSRLKEMRTWMEVSGYADKKHCKRIPSCAVKTSKVGSRISQLKDQIHTILCTLWLDALSLNTSQTTLLSTAKAPKARISEPISLEITVKTSMKMQLKRSATTLTLRKRIYWQTCSRIGWDASIPFTMQGLTR